MKVYLAARFSRQEEMRGYAVRLQDAGHEVTARWPYVHETDDGLGAMEPDGVTDAFAREDCADVREAQVVLSFTEGGGGRGGRHVEFGYALALGKRLVVVGPREHVFHSLAERVDTFEDAVALLGGAS